MSFAYSKVRCRTDTLQVTVTVQELLGQKDVHIKDIATAHQNLLHLAGLRRDVVVQEHLGIPIQMTSRLHRKAHHPMVRDGLVLDTFPTKALHIDYQHTVIRVDPKITILSVHLLAMLIRHEKVRTGVKLRVVRDGIQFDRVVNEEIQKAQHVLASV